MGDFHQSYAKHNGRQTLKKVFREHLVTSTALTVCAVGVRQKGLEILQLELNHKMGCRIEKRFGSQLESLRERVEEEYAAAPVFQEPKVWSLWLQGEESAPLIVKRCLSSVRDSVGVSNHVVLTAQNMADYIAFPDFIMKKHSEGKICDANFSDLVRLELLTQYGGVWTDATVFFSALPPAYQFDAPLFLFQTLPPGSSGETIPVSSWYIAAQKPSKVLLMARALMFQYWEQFDYAMDYFLFHYFLMMAGRAYPEEWNKIIPCSNEAPQILSARLLDAYDPALFDAVTQQTAIHKLTYKLDFEDAFADDTFYKRLISEIGD